MPRLRYRHDRSRQKKTSCAYAAFILNYHSCTSCLIGHMDIEPDRMDRRFTYTRRTDGTIMMIVEPSYQRVPKLFALLLSYAGDAKHSNNVRPAKERGALRMFFGQKKITLPPCRCGSHMLVTEDGCPNRRHPTQHDWRYPSPIMFPSSEWPVGKKP